MVQPHFDQLPLELARQVDAACVRFERAFKAGQNPHIETFLADEEESAGPVLLHELLSLEVELLQRSGETPSVDDYVKRFPEAAETVRSIFKNETVTQRGAQGTITSPVPQPASMTPVATTPESSTIHRDETVAEQPLGQLRDYELQEELGRGGMGTVYRAVHTKLGKTVALKVLNAERMKDTNAVARFEREMKAVGALDHPNIVRATDAGEADGTHYLVMDFVEGLDLSRLVRVLGPLPQADACELVRQGALGLQHANEHGLIHRDVKPSNLIVSKGGTVKVLDLGLARLHEGQFEDGVPGNPGDDLTTTGQIMGTIDYMAPEQATDTHRVDIRADVYSLGCTLYKLLSGHAPYSDPGYSNLYLKIRAHAELPVPSIAEKRPELSPALVTTIERMLAKDPVGRFDDPGEVAEALRPFADGSDVARLCRQAESGMPLNDTGDAAGQITSAPVSSALTDTRVGQERDDRQPQPQPLRRYAKTWAAIGAAAAFFIVLLGIMFTLKTPDGTLIVEINEDDAVVQVLDEEGKIEITRQGEKGKLSISVDPGKHRLKVEKDGFKLFTEDFELEEGGETIITARLEPLKIPAEAKAKPRSAASDESDSGRRMDESEIDEGGIKLVRTLEGHSAAVEDIAFTPKAEQLVSGSRDGTVRLWNLGTGRSETLAELEGCIFAVDISLDGTQLVVGPQGMWLQLIHLDSRRTEKLPGTWESRAARFSPNGKILALAPRRVGITLLRFSDWQTVATLDLPFAEVSGLIPRDITFSADSNRVVYCVKNVFDAANSTFLARIAVWNIAESKYEFEIQTEDEGSGWDSATISPDGTTIAYGGIKETKLHNINTGEVTGVLKHDSGITACAYSPNGNLLAGGAYNGNLYFWRVVDQKRLLRLPAHTGAIDGVRFSPCGTLLATCSGDKTIKIWDVSALTQPETVDPERRAAEWVLGIGGQLSLAGIGGVSAIEELPAEPFHIREIWLIDNKSVDDASVRNLRGLSHLHTLSLSGTSITNEALRTVGLLTSLRYLNLGVTEVDDAGLGYLKPLASLEQLTLQFTEVTADGLSQLAELPRLRSLHIYDVPLGQAGMEALAENDSLVSLFIGIRDHPSKLGLDRLDRLKNLKCLCIGGSHVGDADIGPLLKLKGLEVLYFGDTQVTEAGLAELRKSLPHCKVLTETGSWHDEKDSFLSPNAPPNVFDSQRPHPQ